VFYAPLSSKLLNGVFVRRKNMGEPLLIEIIAYAPTAFYHCTHCEVAWKEMGKSNREHEEQLESSLPEDLQREYLAVSNWVKEMFRVHCDRLVVKVIDAASIEGLFKSLRYNARRYPAVIVNRDTRFTGESSLQSATSEIDRLLTEREITANPV
jgi:hypothetical protein